MCLVILVSFVRCVCKRC